MELITVYDKDINEYEDNKRLLYKILSQRKEHQNISHRKLPLYHNHEKFVNLRPYKEWFIIRHGMMKVGSIYITEKDEIGLFILEEYQEEGYGTFAVQEIFKLYPNVVFYANINPRNYKSINFFRKFGFIWGPRITDKNIEAVQETYVRL